MLPRENRISRKDFPLPQKNGLRIQSPLFSASLYKTTGTLRVTVVVSKKIAKTAVTRNRIRRRFYNAVTFYRKRLVFTGLMVLYPKKESILVPLSTLKMEMEAVLIRSRLM